MFRSSLEARPTAATVAVDTIDIQVEEFGTLPSMIVAVKIDHGHAGSCRIPNGFMHQQQSIF
jgi:hypothetical protein